MADLILSGNLLLSGTLKLATTSGGKVKVDSAEVLVVEGAEGKGIPVIQPPPPATPVDTGPKVVIKQSFNRSVTANNKTIVAQGVCMQGNTPTWPGMVLPSTQNNGAVKANGIPINVEGDSGITLPNGGSVTFNTSGQ